MSVEDSALNLQQLAADPQVPEALRKILAAGTMPDEIRLDAGGRWLANGIPVAHPRVVTQFHRSLKRTDQGNWLLEVGRYAYPVVVEDTGRFVIRLSGQDRAPQMWLSDGHSEPFVPAAVMTNGETFFGTHVRGDEPARFVGQAMLALAELLEEQGGQVGVATAAGWWPLLRRA